MEAGGVVGAALGDDLAEEPLGAGRHCVVEDRAAARALARQRHPGRVPPELGDTRLPGGAAVAGRAVRAIVAIPE